MKKSLIPVFSALFLLVSSAAAFSAPLSSKELLGKYIFYDTRLSCPTGQSCSSCHDPKTGYADPDCAMPTSQGAVSSRFGSRNAPTASYACFSPDFQQDPKTGEYVGGQFWDGRAKDLAEQAKGPFLNPVEMNNPNKASVVKKVLSSCYRNLFIKVYGGRVRCDVGKAYDDIADAIAAYESTREVNRFTSKYDYYLAGKVDLTDDEKKGLELFKGKGNCASCHPCEPSCGKPPLFTTFKYYNVGVPKNPENPFYCMPPIYNPDGVNFIDLGLGKTVGSDLENGKMKVPTLRNCAASSPYMHNGVFRTLGQVLGFYNEKAKGEDEGGGADSCGDSGSDAGSGGMMSLEPEVKENITDIGNKRMCWQHDLPKLEAFLMTLTDGYVPVACGPVK